MEVLDLDELRRQAEAFGKPKILRAAEHVARLAETEAMEYEAL